MSDDRIERLLSATTQGDQSAFDELTATLYGDLRRVSAALMRREAVGHTLQPTALVNEAFLRLVEGESRWESRVHFFRAAAQAMRRILIDHARAKAAVKRGGERRRVTFDELQIASEDNQIDLLALDEALKALESENPRLAQVVEMRYFAGFSIEETADLLQVSPATVKRDWLYARAWLFECMDRGGPSA